MASAAERPAVALVAAAVVRLTTGWVAARRKTTTRVVVAGEEEEQLQSQNQIPTQTPHSQSHSRVLGRRESSRRGEACIRRGMGHRGEGVEEGARRTHRPRSHH